MKIKTKAKNVQRENRNGVKRKNRLNMRNE